MRRPSTTPSRRLAAVGALGGVALLGTALAAGPASAGDDSDLLLKSGVAGSTPLTATPPGVVLAKNVNPGVLPWVAGKSTVVLTRDGRLKAKVRGLVIPTPPQNGTNPVPKLSASVLCNGTDGPLTDPVTFTPAGNATFDTKVMLPATCLAPAVLFHPNQVPLIYIGATG